jgi:hypothetical protein
MSRSRVWWLAGGLICAVAAQAAPPPREVFSENRQFLLEVEPGRTGRSGRSCQATLWQRVGSDPRGRKVWQRSLVNQIAPARVNVRNDGRFVVTLDEYRRGGARNAVVIYGADGQLLRHFLLTDLLTRADWPQVRAERRAVVWLEGARCGFDDQHDHFVIRLAWGRELRIDLRALRVLRTEARPADADDVPAALRALLGGEEAPVDASNSTFAPSELTELTAEERARAAEVAAEVAQVPLPPGLPHDADSDATEGDIREERLPADIAPSPGQEELVVEIEGLDDGASHPSGISVPAPDLANKVDYLAWLNDLGRVEPEEDAWPLLQNAAASFVPWTGSAELLWAAERGEAEALNHPDIAAWVEANAAALEAFRRAGRLGSRGWEYQSEDGSLLGVRLPHVAKLRSLAKLCVLDGRRRAAAGDPTAAAERYLDVVACGRQVGEGLTMIEHLVGLAVQALGATALLELQAKVEPGALDCEALAAQARAVVRPLRSGAEVIQVERATLLDALQRLWSPEAATGEAVFDHEAARTFFGGLVEGDEQRLEELVGRLEVFGFDRCVADANAWYDEVTAAFSQPFAEAAARFAELERRVGDGSLSSPVLEVLAPSVSKYHFLLARGEAVRRAALAVMELNAYRQQFGAYPDSLPELGNLPVLRDPFTGGSFAYRRQADGFVLYSVGANGTDEGGLHDRRGDKNDIVLWPPP